MFVAKEATFNNQNLIIKLNNQNLQNAQTDLTNPICQPIQNNKTVPIQFVNTRTQQTKYTPDRLNQTYEHSNADLTVKQIEQLQQTKPQTNFNLHLNTEAQAEAEPHQNEIRNYNVPDFSSIKASTNTIIAITNLVFNLELFYTYLPITEFHINRKKRGRKKASTVDVQNDRIKQGSLISLQRTVNGIPEVRGITFHKKKNKKKTSFLNSVTAIIMVEKDKSVNIKVSHNGNLQITGCKTEQQCVNALVYLYEIVQHTQGLIGERICHTRNGQNPTSIFNIVMRNYGFDVGFPINRANLDTYINTHTEYKSIFEPSMNPHVSIKINSPVLPNDKMTKIEITKGQIVNESETRIQTSHSYIESTVSYSDYIKQLSVKNQDIKLKKKKYHTFLCFSSGKCILSSSGSQMPDIYKAFLTLIYENHNLIEEKLRTD